MTDWVATLMVMGMQLLSFIVMLFLQPHFAYLGEVYKCHQETWRESNYLPNCDRKSTFQIWFANVPLLLCNVPFAKIFIYFHCISWWQWGQANSSEVLAIMLTSLMRERKGNYDWHSLRFQSMHSHLPGFHTCVFFWNPHKALEVVFSFIYKSSPLFF